MNKEKNKTNSEDYSTFLSFSFQDLLKLSKKDKTVFNALFYNRTEECNKLETIIHNARNRGDNVLITGDAGKGKSSFVYKLVFDEEYLAKENLYCVVVDYGESSGKEHCLLKFIDQMRQYFTDIGEPLHNLYENIPENIVNNIHRLQTYLSDIDENLLKKHLLIFLDDFDYVEDDLFPFLDNFLGFASNQKLTIILSARPQLYTAIDTYDNRYAIYFTRDVQRIKIESVCAYKLLSKRLAALLVKNESNPFIKTANILLNSGNRYKELMKKYGVSNFEKLNEFQLPLKNDFFNFMSQITNGNNREIFDIAHDSILYVLDNYDSLETVWEEVEHVSVEKKVLKNSHVLELFYDKNNLKDYYKKNYRIINIHEFRSKNGNSLYYNTLEAVKIYKQTNEDFYSVLSILGHSQKNIDKAVDILKNKAHRLIVPNKIMPSAQEEDSVIYDTYRTTEKGDCYLTNIATWTEYTERCGSIGKSVSEVL